MATTDVDFVAWDNSDPPQLWAWSGEYGDEAAEPLFRLPADGLWAEWDSMLAENARLEAAMTRQEAAFSEIRDAVLHGRYQLEEPCLDGDQTNAVLAVLDDLWPIREATTEQEDKSDGV